ncbi:MAG: acyl-CoA dehydrogenase family protein [Acidobacteria bacterium]|nr:acyl-CoA dehydrogenase family protein [Acidobacteriota bacterium]MDA1235642.1 acyl-CoA dehydrogenase family protein [Acidobacteriota bacterium]
MANDAPAGGGFLIESTEPAAAFTPEDFSDEQRQTKATADRFMEEEILPVIKRYEQKEDGLARGLIRKAGELGLLSILVPEKYDGLEMNLTSQLLVAESLGEYASFSVTYGAHSGIGTLPLVFFGTDEQKQTYLSRMASGELLAAYCLSEPQAGSDALAARTTAKLSEDGSHYVLNGQKMWISNGGWADIFTVFAKVDGEKFTAFLVEQSFDGVKPGAEEHKMGIHGSSTTPLFLDGVKVPVGNVLGEIGRGHIIAFNILNIGRLKLGASCVGGSKTVISEAIRYAKERKAFGQPIAQFGAIRQKLAESAIRTFVADSVVYRTGGLIDQKLGKVSWEDPEAAKKMLGAIEEYAIECAIAKVVATEALRYVADEGVQVHGGYGFHQDYAVERCYRDERINRIFEGTNEINRLLTVGMLLKRAAQNRLPLMNAVMQLMAELATPVEDLAKGEGLEAEAALVARAKKVALVAAGIGYQKYGAQLEEEQEVVYAIAEIVIAAYSMESAYLRAAKIGGGKGGGTARDIVRVVSRELMGEISRNAEIVLANCLEGAKQQQYHSVLRRLSRYPLVDVVGARRRIADRLVEAERYAL